MADPIIQLKRRIAGAAGPPALSVLDVGEPAYNDNGDELWISNGAEVRTLVSPARQLQLTGAQTVTTGAGNRKLFDTTNLGISGGAAGNILARGANDGELTWIAAPGAGTVAVEVEDPLGGNGTIGQPLTVTPASNLHITTGTDDTFPVTSLGLRSQLGAVASAATLGTTATTIVPAIAELAGQIGALQQAIRFAGTINAATGVVTPTHEGLLPAAALPPAATANAGMMVIATVAGPGGTGNLPAGPIAVADLIISDGTAWILVPLNLGTFAASNVTVTAITNLAATNVQDALAELITAGVLNIHFDGVSIVGDGTTANPRAVGRVNGGTY